MLGSADAEADRIRVCTLPELRTLLRYALAEKREDFASRIADRMLVLHESQKGLRIAAAFAPAPRKWAKF